MRHLTRDPRPDTMPLSIKRLIITAQKRQPLEEGGNVDESPESFPFLFPSPEDR